MKNLYCVKRTWVYRNAFNKLHDSCLVSTEISELTAYEAYNLTTEDDDYEEKFCHHAPEWLVQMWHDCPNMTVNFLGTEVVQLTEREVMFMQGQPEFNFDKPLNHLVIYNQDNEVIGDIDFRYYGERHWCLGKYDTPDKIANYAHYEGYIVQFGY